MKQYTIPIDVIGVVGPTASGKSALALELAYKYGADIISCDSRQIYSGMDIGTAKPLPHEQQSVRHWGIDIRSVQQEFSAHDFAEYAVSIIRKNAEIGKRTIVCGGTGFYYRALTEGLPTTQEADPAVRESILKSVQENGSNSILEELQKVDPESARSIHPHNVKRLIRALEVWRTTGTRLSDFKNSATSPDDIRFTTFITSLPREELYARINARTHEMFRAGLWEEFLQLRQAGCVRSDPGMVSVGYMELFEVEEKRASLDEACALIAQNSRHYAKRQITWFTRQTPGTSILMKDNPMQTVENYLYTHKIWQ